MISVIAYFNIISGLTRNGFKFEKNNIFINCNILLNVKPTRHVLF